VLDDRCWCPRRNGVGWNVSGDDGLRADDTTIAYSNPRKNGCAKSNPNVVPNLDIAFAAGMTSKTSTTGKQDVEWIGRNKICAMLASKQYLHIAANRTILADRERSRVIPRIHSG